jgi:hypothetical protein
MAEQIHMDLIDPELRRIRSAMNGAAEAFARKSAFAVGVSVLTTVVGASAGLTLGGMAAASAIAGGALAAGAALNTAFAKKADTEAELRTSDMWFLWKAMQDVGAGHRSE